MPIPISRRMLWVLGLAGGMVGAGLIGVALIVPPETTPSATEPAGAVATTASRPAGSTSATSAPPATTTRLSTAGTTSSPGTAPTTSQTTAPAASTTTLEPAKEPAEVSAPPDSPGQLSADLFVAPSSLGSGSGLSPADAADISRLNHLVAALPDGGVIELLSDEGPYDVPRSITINAGGTPAQPVMIRGPMAGPRAELRGARTSPYSAASEPGNPLFRLAAGADHLVFTNLNCTNVGNGCFYVSAPITDLTIANVTATNVRRFFENGAGEGQSHATIVGLNISHVQISGFSKGAIRLVDDTHDVWITDVVGDSMQQDGDNFAIGVHLVDTVHDVVIERVAMNNARDTLHEYWNGDGFAAEAGVYDLLMTDTSASGNTDAGYDIKANNVRIVNADASDNKRNFRLWGQNVVLEGCAGSDPNLRGGTGTQAQVHVAEDAEVELVGCTFIDSNADTIVFDVDGRAHLVVRAAYVERAAPSTLSTVEPTATLELLQLEELLR